jgi:hypothetical protein
MFVLGLRGGRSAAAGAGAGSLEQAEGAFDTDFGEGA